MVETILWFILGLIALIGGAELLVRSASKLAGFLGIPKLIIGLTVVAFGTSAPELAISIQAGISGQTDIMLGNIVGSNISNILLIFGLTALIIPLKVNANLIRIDVPVMIGVTLLMYAFAWNGFVTFWECLALSVLLIIYMFFLFSQSRSTAVPVDLEKQKRTPAAIIIYIMIGLTGLGLLIFGSRWLVQSAVILAELAGVSELVIGLTVVAFGTSLPEVVTALVAAFKKERDIAVGSIIGSNILNILAVLGVSGLFIPEAIPVKSALLRFDMLILIAVSFACIPIFFTGHKISRWEGFIFLALYVSYISYLFLSAADHFVLEAFSTTMMLFVIPIIVLTILFTAGREWMIRQRYKELGKRLRKRDRNEQK